MGPRRRLAELTECVAPRTARRHAALGGLRCRTCEESIKKPRSWSRGFGEVRLLEGGKGRRSTHRRTCGRWRDCTCGKRAIHCRHAGYVIRQGAMSSAPCASVDTGRCRRSRRWRMPAAAVVYAALVLEHLIDMARPKDM